MRYFTFFALHCLWRPVCLLYGLSILHQNLRQPQIYGFGLSHVFPF